MRARGLKLSGNQGTEKTLRVAPHAGAWIETEELCRYMAEISVAPHAGAWIETELTHRSQIIIDRRAPCGRVD